MEKMVLHKMAMFNSIWKTNWNICTYFLRGCKEMKIKIRYVAKGLLNLVD